MRTTIDLPDAVFREVKIRAVQQGTTLRALVAKYIEAGLRDHGAPQAPEPHQRAPLPVAIGREPGKPLTGALTNQELEALLEGEDLENSRRVVSRASRDS